MNAHHDGEKNPNHRLSALAVELIREHAARHPGRGWQASLARQFGVSETTISQIVHGTRWPDAGATEQEDAYVDAQMATRPEDRDAERAASRREEPR